MKEHQVTCIIKSISNGAHEHITHIGNIAQGWKVTRELAIRQIEAKTDAYYTVDRTTGKRAYVGVVHPHGGRAPYLQTHADGKWNDNLLAQSECTSNCTLVG